MKKIITYTFLVSLLSIVRLYAQVPSSWSVNPSDYNHSMIITCVLNINSEESRNTQDVIAAFIGADVRGVTSPITYLKSQDRYVATLIVYSNDQNVPVTFKVYDHANNVVSNSPVEPINFVADGIIGTLENPFVFSDSSIPKKINYNNLVTPNGDGHNDVLVIEKLALFDQYTLSIYDIRGQKVYETTNYQNDWNGNNLLNGEYYIYISGRDQNKNNFVYKEILHLIKNQN
jgi:gliding motility-associated-like protein